MHADASHHIDLQSGRVLEVRQISAASVLLVDDLKKEYTFSEGLLPAKAKVGDRFVVVIETEEQARNHRAVLAKELLKELLKG